MVNQNVISLANLLAGIVVVDPRWDRQITGITLNSQEIKPGYLFIAHVGMEHDARDYIPQAIQQGTTAIIAEKGSHHLLNEQNIPIFQVQDLSQYIGLIASRYYGHPSRHMTVIGVTGTNGKTSCTHFLAQLFEKLNSPCGLIGTVGYGRYDALTSQQNTTPDAVTLQKLLADFYHQGIRHIAMEVSSHALAQHRVKSIEFTTAVFTNLSRDHLDYHGTMEEYGAAKQQLFKQFGLRQAIINRDDIFGLKLLKELPETVQGISYSLQSREADVYAENIQLNLKGVSARIHTPWGSVLVETSLLGEFSLSNLLAVVATLGALGIPLNDFLKYLPELQSVTGRMQMIQYDHQPLVVVDYAHTPSALQEVLKALRQHCSQQLCCVFGCGGDRDKGKRPEMGQIATQWADKVIITDDNPRHENPQEIVLDILKGIEKKTSVVIEHNRRIAIQEALSKSKVGDVVLIAGKGHEAYQQVGDEKFPFNDVEVVKEWMNVSA